MKAQPKGKISYMLVEAYHRLGINNVWELDARSKEALEYLDADREHYIEVADPDTPEYLITTNFGVICKLIPLAREIIRDQKKDYVQEHTTVFSLMLSDSGNHYVYSDSYAKLYANASQNSYSYPVYRYTELENVPEGLQLCSPQEIRPAASALDREAYAMMFTAFAHLNQSDDSNSIPHKTERAMQVYTRTPPQELTVAGNNYSGKLVPLAWEESMWEQPRKDHRYSYRKELCLLITQEKPYYILKTHHTYHYFRKVIYDDVPGGCSYEPTDQTQELTYAFVAPSDLPQDMHPLYY